MSDVASPPIAAHRSRAVPRLLIGLGVVLTLAFVAMPVAVIFAQALSKGLAVYRANVLAPDTLHAIYLTVVIAVVVVPVNMLFGLAAAWLITRFAFPGRKLLVTLIELPFSISPIVAGVIYLLLYGAQGLLGPFLEAHDIRIMFALPGMMLVTLFVTSPFVARELIPLMQVQGADQEEAAVTLGASGWQTFWRVTLPNIRWALLYGAVLCTARAIGEFGAVSVVSGNVRGETNTLPLHVELLYHDYNAVGAFAAATTLTLIALVTLVLKALLERRLERR
ncbi:sulfate ABC transporter permease subunit CysW [Chelatococcus sp. SYSU_G07232]|uniref:Sulfate ABC transporter permease subunit CysW n=1 Tax=Chelatococcus albus TaxID=3047466 RepID=A0ABT7AJT8_9HYPH|nr:sulfate ABC transporter permease subunit CysW [Chelatococcus sp. SYSU_G07232]MDJ1159629.1 sulfate ABC transporter permease subunit CysW [Chelatococcus sp. SYSU_G07232]